jgi:hypothetical protein
MKHTRSTLPLPICAILVTSALWLKSRSEFPSSCLLQLVDLPGHERRLLDVTKITV